MITSSLFDPNANKVINTYGGYDSNEKGLFQYPKSNDLTLHNQFTGGISHTTTDRSHIFSKPILDPVTRHYRRFVEDPGLHTVKKNDHEKCDVAHDYFGKPVPCDISKLRSCSATPRRKKPIDPIHWKSDLFDTRNEKYYLRNLLNEDPYREFLSDHLDSGSGQHYCSVYKLNFSGNPVVATTSGKILGLGRPTDLTETIDWRRNHTSKLRDVIFTHEKDKLDSYLDYKDPKRYNPWPRLQMSYIHMLKNNYRPKPGSGVEYSVTTLLPAVAPHSKQWIV